MSGSTISTTITQTVTLGSASYPSPLTVSASGVVTPTLASAIGITATLAASYLDNLGVVIGAAGYGTGHGGYGVYFTAGGTLLNDGTIAGGYGPQIGGAAVRLSDGVVINHGTLRGGAGGDGGQFTGDGLVGLQNDTIINTGFISGMYAGSNSSIINSGLISVGSFAVFPTISNNDSGGYGIFMGASSVDGSLLNTGTVAAGAVGDYGGVGVFAGSSDTVTNQGTSLGGSGTALGGDGVKVSPNDMVINTGFIQGGSGSIAGAGVYLHSQSTLSNRGTIIGGYGASYGNGSRFISDDFVVNGATTDSSALILGNDGVVIQGNSTLINYATISGRNNGLYIEQTISAPAGVTNQATGTITGADFGVYLKSTPSFASTGTFTNAGLITGQENGFVEYGLGGTILNTGSIIGRGAGTPPFADGIFIEGGAEIINGASNATAALISGTGLAFGVDMIKPFVGTLASTGTVINFGTIQGGSLEGVALNAGTVINGTALDSQALITGIKIAGANALVQNFGTLNGDGQTGNALYVGNAGIVLNGAANDPTALIETTAVQNVQLDKNNTLTNYGSIIGGTVNGVYAQSGLISNASTGVIIGGKWGAHVAGYGAQTVINAGLIEGTIALAALANYAYSDVFANSGTIASLLGSTGTAIAFAKGNDLLIDDPTGVFIGTVSGGAGDNTLELAAGGPGSITGIGTQFTQFTNINFDAGASWSAEGNLAGLAGGETINGFAAGDTIILDGFTETGFTYVSGAGLELAGAGTAGATIDIAGSFDTTSFLVQTVAAGTEITKLVTGPVIGGTFLSPQAVTDGQPFNAFGNVTITDAGSGGAETATITMTNAGTATDDNGTLTGAALTKTATGTYTLTADSPAALQAALRAVVFTPALVDTSSNLTTGLTLQVSDGIAAPVTDTNTVIDTVLGPQPLTAAIEPVANDPNAFTSQTRTAETVDANTPVSQTDDTSATVITAVLNGQTVYQQSFDLPYSDPAVQAAIAQADQILATDNATASAPGLTSSAVTNQGSQTTTVVTGQQTSVVPTVTTVFGPGPLFTGLDVNGTPNTTVTLLAGQEDTNVNDDYQTTIDQTVTTTTTQLTTQTYTITGTESATCFAAGTKILSAKGPVRVEDLRIGDMLPTLHGGGQKIKWIGRRDYDGRFIAGNHLMLPVRIRRHALARNVPSRDLVVSPGHGIYLDGVFVPAWRLINGVSITQALQVETVSYFHIELADHAVIFAHNCPVESFLDDGCRRQFSNAPTFDDLYPDDAHAMAPCAPRAEHGFQLAEIQRRMAARAGILPASQTSSALRGFVDQAGPDIVTGWAQLIDHPEAPVSLDILAGGRHVATVLANQYRADLRAAGLGSGCHAFSYAPPRNLTGPVEVRGSSKWTILPKTTAAEILAA